MAWFVLSGLFYLAWGLLMEFGVRPKPLVPASFVPGFLFLCVGAGAGIALLDRYFPKFGTLACWALVPVIFLMEVSGNNSVLPLMLYAGVFQLARALLRVTLPAE
jgi:hypothetical protein